MSHSTASLRRARKLTGRNFVVTLSAAALAFTIVASLSEIMVAQQPVTFQYIYDDLNQLTKVIDSTGVVIQYVYDPVGNIVQINRSGVQPGVLTLFNISPQSVPTGGILTIQGQGFSTTSTGDSVLINGVAATVVSATATTLSVLVPANATTGTVSVTVGGTTVTYTTPVTVVPLPVITSISPKSALAGTTIAAFSVTGVYLTDAMFTFSPSAGVAVSGISFGPGGTSATMTVTLNTSAQGRLTLVATNAAGPSDGIPKLGFLPATIGNTLTVPGSDPNADPDRDGLTNAQEIQLGTDPLNADTDGDTAVDGLEVALGSDPLNPNNLPNPYRSGWFASPVMSMLNSLNPSTGVPGSTQYVSGLTFSMLNGLNPSTGLAGSTQYVSGLTFSMLNNLSPSTGLAGSTQYVSSLTFSMLNGISPAPVTQSQTFANSFFFSILNGTSTSTQSVELVPDLFNTKTIAERVARPWLFLDFLLSQLDSDGDGISDADEIRLGTNPYDRDTDHDGYPDGLEIALGSDPLDPKSIPNINPPGFVISPDTTLQNYALLAQNVAAVKPAEAGRKQ